MGTYAVISSSASLITGVRQMANRVGPAGLGVKSWKRVHIFGERNIFLKNGNMPYVTETKFNSQVWVALVIRMKAMNSLPRVYWAREFWNMVLN